MSIYKTMSFEEILESNSRNGKTPLYTKLQINANTTYNNKKFKDANVLVGDNAYETFEEALEACQDYDTIKLNINVEPSNSYVITNKTFTLDLNGYTIKGNKTFPIFDLNNGHVTVKDSSNTNNGTIMWGKGTYGGAFNASSKKASVTLVSGTLKENEAERGGGAIGLWTPTEGKVNIKGGIIKDNFSNGVNGNGGGAIYLYNENGDNGEIRISGGLISNNGTAGLGKAILMYGCTLNMLGGEIYDADVFRYKGNEDAFLIHTKKATDVINLTFGTIANSDKFSVTECIGGESTNINVKDTFQFKGVELIATVGSENFRDLISAINASSMAKPAVLAKNITLEETLIIPKDNCHIDLNGFTIEGNRTFSLIFVHNKNFKISNSKDNVKGKLRSGSPSIAFEQEDGATLISPTNTVCGGAIYALNNSNSNCTITLDNIIIENNKYEIDTYPNACGTAIYAKNVDVDLINSEIKSNVAMRTNSQIFGTICLCDKSTVEFENTAMRYNECKTFANCIYIGSPNSKFVMNSGELDNRDKSNDLPIIFSHDTSNVDFNTIDIKGGNLADDKESVYQCFDFTN